MSVVIIPAYKPDERLMILGVREVGKDMPLRSRLGNTITRKVFQLLSGVKISDTQTGMRVFTSDLVRKLLRTCPFSSRIINMIPENWILPMAEIIRNTEAEFPTCWRIFI